MTDLQTRYDVVVIGAGLGGMTAAALLARDRYSVLVLEKLPVPGGRYSSEDYRGFKIATGAWALGLHGPEGPVYKTLVDLGCRLDIRIPGPPDRVTRIHGVDVPMPKSGGLRAVISRVARSKQEEERVMTTTRRALTGETPAPEDQTGQAWVASMTDNPLIHGMFDFFIRAMSAINYEDIPAGRMINYLRTFGRLKGVTTTVRDGNGGTTRALVEVMKRHGAQLVTMADVCGITMQRGRATGVVFRDHSGTVREIGADVVVSNVGPRATVELAGRRSFPDEHLGAVDALVPTVATTVIWAYDKPLGSYDGFYSFIDTPRLTTVWEPYHLWPTYTAGGRCCAYAFMTMKGKDVEAELEKGTQEVYAKFPALEKAEIVTSLMMRDGWPILRASGAGLPVRTPVDDLYSVGDGNMPDGWLCGEGVVMGALEAVGGIRSRGGRRATGAQP
jgi:phytoene dehydrogenase-like protein